MSVVTSNNYIDGHYNGVDDLKDTCSLCERKLSYPAHRVAEQWGVHLRGLLHVHQVGSTVHRRPGSDRGHPQAA